MVATSSVIASNASFASAQHSGLVSVFAGATAGIGLATLKKMATMLHSSTFYILGRSPSRFTTHLDKLKEIGPSNNYVFLEAQVSLIASIDAAMHQITSAENKVDYLFMSPGGVPWHGADYTIEGLDSCFAVSYYSRLRMVSRLLPLLHRSSQPRVLSILNGTKEKPINEQDIGLEKQWGVISVVNHTTLLTSLAFDYLAAHDDQKHIVFLHATPGLVNTGSPKQKPKKSDGLLRWLVLSCLKFISSYIVRYTGMSLGESGERHAFELTSDNFAPGSWRVSKSSDIVPDNETLVRYQKDGWPEKVWEFTQGVWDKALIATL